MQETEIKFLYDAGVGVVLAVLLAVAILAISVVDRDAEGSSDVSEESQRAMMIRVTGASPAN